MQGMTAGRFHIVVRALMALVAGLALAVGGAACSTLATTETGSGVDGSISEQFGDESSWFDDSAGYDDSGYDGYVDDADDFGPGDVESASPGIPPHVLDTLALIDAGDWPDAANAPGTQGGERFGNREQLLPKTSADGQRIRYQEWDVNPKEPGQGRDAERIVTGDDGSAWYTADHYASFDRIR